MKTMQLKPITDPTTEGLFKAGFVRGIDLWKSGLSVECISHTAFVQIAVAA